MADQPGQTGTQAGPHLETPPIRQEKEPAMEGIVEVAPDVLWMQLPIAMPGLAHINTYAIIDGDGVAIVDPGLPGSPSWKSLLDRLKKAEIPMARVHTILITHSHPDHFGNAGKLAEESGATVVTHSAFQLMYDPFTVCSVAGCVDVDHAHADVDQEPLPTEPKMWIGERAPWGGTYERPSDAPEIPKGTQFLADHGWVLPRPQQRVRNGDRIMLGRREWQAVHTSGHTLDHLCLYDPSTGTLLSGDHILPTITPHISGMGSGRDSLGSFFASLDRCAALPDLTTALPAHGRPFGNVATRIEDIKEHHSERLRVLARVSQAADGPTTVKEYSHFLFRKERWGSMAESETYAHLVHLEVLGEATRSTDEDGTVSFTIP